MNKRDGVVYPCGAFDRMQNTRGGAANKLCTPRPASRCRRTRSVGRSVVAYGPRVRPESTTDVQRKPFSPLQCNPETYVCGYANAGRFLTYLILDLRELRFTGPPRYGTLSPHEYAARLLLFFFSRSLRRS